MSISYARWGEGVPNAVYIGFACGQTKDNWTRLTSNTSATETRWAATVSLILCETSVHMDLDLPYIRKLLLLPPPRRNVIVSVYLSVNSVSRITKRCGFFCRAMLCINAACAVARMCPSVRPSITFMYSVETSEHIFKIFHQRVSTP